MANERTRLKTTRRNARSVGLPLLVLSLLLVAPLVSKAAKIPAHFGPYATTDIGNGLNCVVGATTKDGGGWDERAYVYVEEAASHKIRWVTSIPKDADSYQNRASHCLADGSKVYALVQSDTSDATVTSQTFINVAVLDLASGHIDSNKPVVVPKTKGAYTIFVYKGADSFRSENGNVVVKGEYASKDDPAETRKPFTETVPMVRAR